VDENLDLARWQGWTAPAPPGPTWTDLSHALNAAVSRVAMFPAPSFGTFMSIPGDPLNVTEIRMVAHVGTHLDAPSHFIPDGPAIDQIPLARLYGQGVVWPVRRRAGETIGPDDLDGASLFIRRCQIGALSRLREDEKVHSDPGAEGRMS
jgi:arylformamidase